jgi:hypothetical protein
LTEENRNFSTPIFLCGQFMVLYFVGCILVLLRISIIWMHATHGVAWMLGQKKCTCFIALALAFNRLNEFNI